MHHVLARNVNDALLQGLNIFRNYRYSSHTGLTREVHPRGQRRLELCAPYITTYTHPRERVLFHPVRDCNPFFHLMESLWILAGRKDVAWLSQWLPSIADYSDDGQTFHGAYGARLHRHDQVQQVINRLHAEPDSTRCVLQIYAASRDSTYTGKDMPCNTTIFLTLRDNVLDLTVCNRSNDLIWGAYGANAVQFSMLQEYIAASLNADCGRYVQFSNNTHIYPDNEATRRCLGQITEMRTLDPYDNGTVEPHLLVRGDIEIWSKELMWFVASHSHRGMTRGVKFSEPFFRDVATPIADAHHDYRASKIEAALETMQFCAASDWRVACTDWLHRRLEKRREKEEAKRFGQPHHGHGIIDATGEAR